MVSYTIKRIELLRNMFRITPSSLIIRLNVVDLEWILQSKFYVNEQNVSKARKFHLPLVKAVDKYGGHSDSVK